jgi:hypothetical protein
MGRDLLIDVLLTKVQARREKNGHCPESLQAHEQDRKRCEVHEDTDRRHKCNYETKPTQQSPFS